MRYVSTRGAAPVLGFADTVLAGLASDGGLYVPEEWPSLPAALPTAYADLAAAVFSPFAAGDFGLDAVSRMTTGACSSFRHPDVVPVVPLEDGHSLMELFHGPTLAFKDVALQFLGRLFDEILTAREIGRAHV